MTSRQISIIPCERFFLQQLAACFSVLLSCLFTLPAWAVEVYFAEPNTISYQAKKISSSLKSSTEDILNRPIETISSKAASAMAGDSNLIVAIGPEALLDIMSGQGSAPVVAVFISKSSFETILRERKTHQERVVTAVFSDPDPLKQVALAKILYGANSTSVVVNSPAVHTYVTDYEDAANRLGINLVVVHFDEIHSTSDFIKSTKLAKSIFLLKDQDLFQHIPLEKILLSSYDINRQGVIGYSSGLVKNGAAATTYSSLPNIAHSIASQAALIEKKGSLRKPNFTVTFEVTLNKYILRSLDVVDTDEDALQDKIVELIRRVKNNEGPH